MFIGAYGGGMKLHPDPATQSVSVRQAIGHLPIGAQGNQVPQLIAAWHKADPGQALRKAVTTVASMQEYRLDPDRPSNTQTKEHWNWHYAVARQLTVTETMTLCGFPIPFRMDGGKKHIVTGLGNSVPPLLIRAVARHVRTAILEAAA